MVGRLLLFLGFFPLAVFAHNGQVALAVPVQGIAVDGDLGDWPAGMRTYPFTFTVAGTGISIEAELLETISEELRQVRHPGMEQGSTFVVSLPAEWRPATNAKT